MKVLVFGGTRFIGLALIADLLAAGHRVAVVHRGLHEPEGLSDVRHIHVERRDLAERRGELLEFGPDAAVDMAAMSAEDAEALTAVLGPSIPLVAVSSSDVYRACSSIAEGKVTESVPLAEGAPLREGPSPDRDYVPPGWDYDPQQYEKLAVERIYLDHRAVVCRLPMVYGEHDYKRREEFVLRRVRAGRHRIPVGPGTFLCSRAHAPEVARGLRLALESGLESEVFNLAEPDCGTISLWVEEILAAAGHEAELVRVADDLLPEDLELTAEIPQPWLVSSARAAERLNWVHAPWRECVRKSVEWHLAHPPGPEEDDLDFSADEIALEGA